MVVGLGQASDTYHSNYFAVCTWQLLFNSTGITMKPLGNLNNITENY